MSLACKHCGRELDIKDQLKTVLNGTFICPNCKMKYSISNFEKFMSSWMLGLLFIVLLAFFKFHILLNLLIISFIFLLQGWISTRRLLKRDLMK